MRLLDLFCGAGGAAMGYLRAGFEVWGVDDMPQPSYPGKFLRQDWEDVIELAKDFDVIHASPPCQRYSIGNRPHGSAERHPDLVAPVRSVLRRLGKPFVIENVVGAPLERPFLLCGTMFGLKVFRHRLFETNADIWPVPFHQAHDGTQPDRIADTRRIEAVGAAISAWLGTISSAAQPLGPWGSTGCARGRNS